MTTKVNGIGCHRCKLQSVETLALLLLPDAGQFGRHLLLLPMGNGVQHKPTRRPPTFASHMQGLLVGISHLARLPTGNQPPQHQKPDSNSNTSWPLLVVPHLDARGNGSLSPRPRVKCTRASGRAQLFHRGYSQHWFPIK